MMSSCASGECRASATKRAQDSKSWVSQRSFTNFSFTRPSVTITWLIALMNATLVPGFSGRW